MTSLPATLPLDSTLTAPPAASASVRFWRRRHILPGFGLTLGITVFYLSALILLPLIALCFKAVTPTEDYPTFSQVLSHVWNVVTDARAVQSYKISFGLSFLAAFTSGFFGLISAWTLTRYNFPGRRIIDALIDLPFAMPTAVAGIALTALFSKNGDSIGTLIYDLTGFQVAYSAAGIFIALVFIGFPFVVRTLQPIMSDLSLELEEAAACLGANRWQTMTRVILPAVRPGLITGMMLAFGRAVGEYGSVTFISGNFPYRTEITPHLIFIRLDEYDYAGAAALGVLMLVVSFTIVGAANTFQYYTAKRRGLVK